MKFDITHLGVAEMLAPREATLMLEFVANIDRLNALAEQSEGFVWRHETDD